MKSIPLTFVKKSDGCSGTSVVGTAWKAVGIVGVLGAENAFPSNKKKKQSCFG